MRQPPPFGGVDEAAERRVMTSLSPLPPNPYGTYTVIGKLGHGRLAEILLGTMPSLNSLPQLVVIKRLHRHLLGDEEFVRAFRDEIAIAVKLDHENVAKTYDHGTMDGDSFFVMEYLEGQGLDRVVRRCLHRGVAIPAEQVAAIGIQALEGLHYAHEARDAGGVPLRIIHRDVRPQNIFITYEGKVKVLDFGIAKAATKVVQSSLGTVKGKFGYTAPELIESRPIDRRADLWSLGVVLWEALAGRPLFPSTGSVQAQLASVLEIPVPDLLEVAPATPPSIAEVVRKALQREPDQRYHTARAMAEQLRVADRGRDDAERLARLSDFMRELFADVIARNRAAVAQCLDGKRVSGSYDIPPADTSQSSSRRLEHKTSRLSRVTVSGGTKRSEHKLYFVLAAVVAAILIAAVALRLWGPWSG